MTGFDQCVEVFHKQGAQQCRNVQTIGIGIGEDNYLAITKF